jgi:hypothetical protein
MSTEQNINDAPGSGSTLNVGLDVADPITMGDGDMHCAPECPYLETDAKQMCCGTCKRDGKPIDYYDWFLARCKGQCDETANFNI